MNTLRDVDLAAAALGLHLAALVKAGHLPPAVASDIARRTRDVLDGVAALLKEAFARNAELAADNAKWNTMLPQIKALAEAKEAADVAVRQIGDQAAELKRLLDERHASVCHPSAVARAVELAGHMERLPSSAAGRPPG
jgi:hypothetical protein